MKTIRFCQTAFIFAILTWAIAGCKDDNPPSDFPVSDTLVQQITGTWGGTCYFHGETYDIVTQTISSTYDTAYNSTVTIAAVNDSMVTINGCQEIPGACRLVLQPGDSVATYHGQAGFGYLEWWVEVNVNSKKITTILQTSHDISDPSVNETRGEFFY